MEETANKKSPSAPAKAVKDYPRGAFRAWCTVIGSALFIFCELGTLTAFGVYQDYYTREWLKNYTASDISWIGSLQAFLELALGIFAGKLGAFYDHYICPPLADDNQQIRRRLLPVNVNYCFCFVLIQISFSYFMLSFAQQGQYYQVFLPQGVGIGISMGLLFVPGVSVSLRHFKTEAQQALANGIIFASGSLGAVIYAIMLNYLLNSGIGFAWSVRATALLSTILLPLANLMITIPPRLERPPSSQISSQKSLFHWPYILVCMSGFFAILGGYFPFFFIQLFAVQHGISKTLVFYSLAIINVSSMFSRVGINSLVKRFGVFSLSIISCTLTGCAAFSMLAGYTPQGLVIFSIFYGTCYGSSFSLYGPISVRVAPIEDTGKVLGYAWTASAVAAVIGSPIGAALVGNNYIWWKGVVFVALCFLVAAVLQLVARTLHFRHMKQKESQSQPETTLIYITASKRETGKN